jgi:dTDP-4-dehydrorhamnose reductase
MLAEVTAQMIAMTDRDVSSWLHERRGLYHLAGSGFTSRLEWGKAILSYDPNEEEQVAQEILPAQTSDFTTPAQRPLFSALNCELFYDTFNLRMPPWKETLQLAMSIK